MAISSNSKRELVYSIGADLVTHRDRNIVDALGEDTVDVVIDNMAGSGFPKMLKVLKLGPGTRLRGLLRVR